MIGISVALFCPFGIAQESTARVTLSLNSIVVALEKAQTGGRPRVSYQVIREYHLFATNDPSANSEVVAEVNFRPPAAKDYRIEKSSGSNRGQQIVRRILDREVATTDRDHAHTALNRDNYDFNYMGETILDGQTCYLLALKPKRKEKDLISGEAWVDPHTFLIRQIEGEVARSPSWWLKKVRVKITFAVFEGTWLQTSMEAIADVRIVGPHTLTSHILDYRSADELASTETRVPVLDGKR
jgi:tRNA nucleotidyltransferase/poly(A) polymerase